PQIPYNLIKKYSKKGDVVLDNFVGSGTTLVEACILGRNSIGIDINYYPCLISSVKTTILTDTDGKDLNENIERIKCFISAFRAKNIDDSDYDDLKVNNKLEKLNFISRLYSSSNLKELLIIKSLIDAIKEKNVRNVLLISFIGILRKVSYLTSNFANDYVPRNKDKVSDVLQEFLSEFEKVYGRIKEFNEVVDTECDVKIINEDTRNLSLDDESVDLIINHPPYISAVPYAEYFKLEMIWLGLDPKELNATIIGGKRSSAQVVERFNEGMQTAFKEMYRVLRKGKYACVVIGNARVKGKIIESNKDFIEFGTKAKFKFIKDIERKKLDCSHAWMKKEHILIFKKE
ncbi:site-specific DNA-methyltransferase, partial [Candidatus Woesearchaeota archaeon]|nr:site-specific DNA-methyltransferase [Candidatus Woesearchaeota archaeon]